MTPRGRPKLEEPRDSKLLIRLTAKERELTYEVATQAGKSESSYWREEVLKIAKRRIK